MATELEIKLTLSEPAQRQALDWLLALPEAEKGPRKTLVNRYYDTPDAALNKAKAALRVRQAGDRYIQTLKTRGEFVNGAHNRQEWEWDLPGPELDLSLLEQTPLAGQLDLRNLALAFETNFSRQEVLLKTADSLVEVAVDSGEVLGAGKARALHEVEFELKSGAPSSLMAWAEGLAGCVPVFLNLVSKAEQGYYLAGIYRPTLSDLDAPLTVTEFLHQLSQNWLLDQPLGGSEAALAGVEQAAIAAGEAALWQEFKGLVESGKTVPELMAQLPRLGELQLALAQAN